MDEDDINNVAFDDEGNLNVDNLIARFMKNYGGRERDSANYQIETLEKLKYGDDFSNTECPICYDNLTNGVLLPCMHTACRHCITEYFQVCHFFFDILIFFLLSQLLIVDVFNL